MRLAIFGPRRVQAGNFRKGEAVSTKPMRKYGTGNQKLLFFMAGFDCSGNSVYEGLQVLTNAASCQFRFWGPQHVLAAQELKLLCQAIGFPTGISQGSPAFKDRMTLISKGPIALCYESLYDIYICMIWYLKPL